MSEPLRVQGVSYQPTYSFALHDQNGGRLLTIHPDGTVERGEAFTTEDAASLTFWQAVERFGVRRLLPEAPWNGWIEAMAREVYELDLENTDRRASLFDLSPKRAASYELRATQYLQVARATYAALRQAMSESIP